MSFERLPAYHSVGRLDGDAQMTQSPIGPAGGDCEGLGSTVASLATRQSRACRVKHSVSKADPKGKALATSSNLKKMRKLIKDSEVVSKKLKLLASAMSAA